MSRERERFIKISPRKQLAMLGGASALLLMGAGTACGEDQTPPPGSVAVDVKEGKVLVDAKKLGEVVTEPVKQESFKGAFEGAKAGVAEGLKSLPTAPAPRPGEQPKPQQPEKPLFPDFTSRALTPNEWNLIKKGEVIAGDIRTGEKKLYDEDRSTGLVTVPTQDMYVAGDWGGTVYTPRNPNDPDAVQKLTKAVVDDMLLDGCGTGIGCPGGVKVSDGFGTLAWRMPNPK